MDGGTDARRITIHAPEDFPAMRTAGRLAAEALDMIVPHVRPGVTTRTLDALCHEFIIAHGAVPAPLNELFTDRRSLTTDPPMDRRNPVTLRQEKGRD